MISLNYLVTCLLIGRVDLRQCRAGMRLRGSASPCQITVLCVCASADAAEEEESAGSGTSGAMRWDGKTIDE